jgi:peptidoglycan/LPS O-acetylase OafA/YrhL
MPLDFRLSKPSSLLLDLVRGTAAQAVVVGHALSFFGVAQIPYLQNSAVAVFFLLSGIVIPYSTFRKVEGDPHYSFSSYLVDRFSRIYMGLVPALVFVAALDFLNRSLFGAAYRYGAAYDVRTFIGNLLMLQDHPFQVAAIRVVADRLSLPLSWIATVTSFGSARPFWTIAVEWWIYLLFGWVALGGPVRRKHPVLFWVLLLFFLAVPGFNWVLDGRGNGLTMTWGMGLVILGLLSRLPQGWFKSDAALLAGFFVTSALARVLRTREAYDPLFVGLLAVSLYFALSDLQGREGTRLPKGIQTAIVFNASFSYTLYLVHYSVLDFLVNWRGPGMTNVVLGFVLSNLLAFAMYEAFEKHYRALGRQLKRAMGISAPGTA